MRWRLTHDLRRRYKYRSRLWVISKLAQRLGREVDALYDHESATERSTRSGPDGINL